MTDEIKHRPIYIDMFDGTMSYNRPKSAPGNKHVKLKGKNPVAIKGMAHFAGTSPVEAKCAQCAFYGTVLVDGLSIESAPRRCAKATALSGKLVPTDSRLSHQWACKYYQQDEVIGPPHDSRHWLITSDGQMKALGVMDASSPDYDADLAKATGK